MPYLPGRPYSDFLFASVDFLDPNGVRTVNQIETGNVVKTFTGELFMVASTRFTFQSELNPICENIEQRVPYLQQGRYVIIVTVSNWLFTDFLLLLHSEASSYAASLSRKLSQAGRLARLILHSTLLMSPYPLLHSSGNAALRIQVIQKRS